VRWRGGGERGALARSSPGLLRRRTPSALRQLLADAEADAPLLRVRLDALQAAWQLQHAPGVKTVSFGVWPPGAAVGEVLLKRGKGWQAFGQHTGARTLLYPEETLFLMESDRLVCFPDVGARTPLTLHAGYAAAAAAGVSSARYAAFAHLCRMGFVVRRCGLPWFLDRRGWAHAAHEEAELEASGDAQPAAAGAGSAPEGEDEEAPDGWLADCEAARAEPDEAAQPPLEEATQPVTQEPSQPPCADADAVPAHEGACRGWWPASAWEPAPLPAAAAQPAVRARSPQHARLPAEPAWGAPEVVYDVWPPRSTFNKRLAGAPQFRLCLCEARPPSAAELAAMSAASAPVPVKCVIVKPGIFMGFEVGLSAAVAS
jgi:hypothetical protein